MATFGLQKEDVHLWWADLDVEVHHTNDYYLIISMDEKNRAARYRFQQHRDNFIITHGLLRVILSQYLNTDPRKLCFIYKEFGKPSLDVSFNDSGLSFNLSHSNGIILYAITCSREIGVDIEYVFDSSCLEEISERFLSPRERKIFCMIPPYRRRQALFEYWTCKEAYIKATGRGHSVPLNQVEVLFLHSNPEIVLASKFRPKGDYIWSLQKIESPQGYIAALAVEGNDFKLNNYFCANLAFLDGKYLWTFFSSRHTE